MIELNSTFVFEGSNYEIRRRAEGDTLVYRAYRDGKPASFEHHVDHQVNASIRRKHGFNAHDDAVASAITDVRNRFWESYCASRDASMKS